MKNVIFLMVILFLSVKLYSQTTLEEYNYLTKGLRIQQESGLDMKKGYELKSVDFSSLDNKKVELFKLTRTNTKNTAAYLIIFTSGSTKEYICIPTKDCSTEIRDLFFQQLSNNTFQAYRLSLISLVLSRNLSSE
jgi:hypothetical protein